MPDWAQLVTRLLDDARETIPGARDDRLEGALRSARAGDYKSATDAVQSVLGTDDFARALASHFGHALLYQATPRVRGAMERRMRNIVAAPWAGIATTNYDSLLEIAVHRFSSRDHAVAEGVDASLGSILCDAAPGKPFLVKLHGSALSTALVIGTDEYDRAYLTNPQITAFLTALMLRYHLVFIGCSLEDEVMRLRRRLCAEFQGRIPTAYALLPDTPANRQRRTHLHDRAQVYSHLYTPDEDHTPVDDFLQAAADCAETTEAPAAAKEGTLRALAAMSPADRMARIGVPNNDIIGLVRAAPDAELRHGALLSLSDIDDSAVTPDLLRMAPDERAYRALFLCAVGLLEERVTDGKRTYRLAADIGDDIL